MRASFYFISKTVRLKEKSQMTSQGVSSGKRGKLQIYFCYLGNYIIFLL